MNKYSKLLKLCVDFQESIPKTLRTPEEFAPYSIDRDFTIPIEKAEPYYDIKKVVEDKLAEMEFSLSMIKSNLVHRKYNAAVDVVDDMKDQILELRSYMSR